MLQPQPADQAAPLRLHRRERPQAPLQDREQRLVAAATPESRRVHHHVLLPPPIGSHREGLPTASPREPDRARPCSLWRLAEPLTSEASPWPPQPRLPQQHHAHLQASPLRLPSPEEPAAPHACPAYWRASRRRGWWLSDRGRELGKNCSAGEPKLRIRSAPPRPAGPQSSNTTATASTLAWHTQLYRDTVASTGKHEFRASTDEHNRRSTGEPAERTLPYVEAANSRFSACLPGLARTCCGFRLRRKKIGPVADLLQDPWAIGTPASRSPPNRS